MKRINLLYIIIALCICISTGSGVSAQSGQWEIMLQPEIKIFRGLWGTSGSDVFAVGDQGLIMHFNGIEWKQMDSNTGKNLEGIWGSSGTDVFAAGDEGIILHYNGIIWKQMDGHTKENLTAIWGTSGSDVFVSGSGGIILHYNGAGWRSMGSNNEKNIYDLWGTSGADVFAVGGNGSILHYDGSKWLPMDSGTNLNFLSVKGTSGSDIIAAGPNILMHFDGRNWSQINEELFNFRCIWGNTPSDIYIGGNNQDNNDTGFIFHYNGSELNKIDIDPDIPVYALWGSSDSNIFAAGGNPETGGTILHFDGINWNLAWQQSEKGSVKELWGVWGSSGNNVFAVGEQGSVTHYDGKNWSSVDSGTKEDLRGIWGYSDNIFFVVGEQGIILRFDGHKWINMPSDSDGDLYRIWGYIENPESEPELFAAGENGTILYYDKNKWSSMDSGTNKNLKNIWGNSSSDIYAAGDHGTLLHYDGNKWSSFNNIKDKDLQGIWGSAENNIYAAGDSNNITTSFTSVLNYNGLNWRTLSTNEIYLTTNEYFSSIWGRSQDNIFLAGSKTVNFTESNPVIWHYNGKIWSPMSISAGTRINDIWGLSSNISPVTEVFAIMGDGTIAHYWEISISLPESVNEADGILKGYGIVSIKDTLEKDLVISLSSDDTSEIILPGSLIIPAGRTSNTFDIIVKDDNFPDGTQDVIITASAFDYNSGSRILQVNDNESIELKINIPLKINEADALIESSGKVSIPEPAEDDIYVTLSSDNLTAVKVPPGITIPAGMNEAFFDMMAVDDTEIDGIQTALVTAGVKGWISAFASIEAADDDKYGLSLELPETAKESDAILKNAGIVSMPVVFSSDILINLSSEDISEISLPETVIIPAGSTSAAFDLFPLEDFLLDDLQSVNITASSPEFISAVAVIDIQDSDVRWTVMEKGTSNLRCLWGSSKDDIFAAGWYGVIMHHDGNKWQHMKTNTETHLRGIWGSSQDNVFAVGNDGMILHYNGKEWTIMDSGTDMIIYDIWGSSETDVFAAGGNSSTGGIILHYDGKKWDIVKDDLKNYIRSLWGVSANNIIAVGEKGTIIHYDGKNWNFMENSNDITLKGVWGITPDDYFALGSGLILHYNGIDWKNMETGQDKNLINIWGTSKDNIYAIGYSGTILHYDGFSWQEMESGTQDSLWGIWGTPDSPDYDGSEIFISGVDGLILKSNENLWEISKDTDTYFKGIWCPPQKTDTAAYAVGENGTIVFYEGTTWNIVENGFYPNLNSIWGSSDSEIFAVGDEGVILRYDGFRWRKTDSGVYENLNDVSGLVSEYDNDVFAVGDNGTILHFDGSLWLQMESPTNMKLRGVWAVSGESGQYNIIAAGDEGLILHYNGSRWQQMKTGTSNNIYDVWGSSLSDIFAVGPSGTILHYDGNQWQNIEIVNNTLTGVWGRSPSDVYITGYSGTILHYDGFKWTNMDTINRPLTGICGNEDLEIFAAGRDNTIVHTQFIGIELPEFAEESEGILAGRGNIFIGKAQDKDIVVRLTSHDISEIRLPASITIPAGQTSGSFDLTIIEDDICDGLQRVPVTASAQNLSIGTGFISIVDNEIADINLELPENINEGDGEISGKGIVSISRQAGKDINISLTSDSPLDITVPKEIIIPKGKDKVSFDFSVIDNDEFNDTRTVIISASVKAWNPVSTSIEVSDNEVKEIELVIPAEASENDRIIKGNLSIPGTFESDLILELSSDDTGEILVPQSITIPAGKINVEFDLNIIDDPDIDGSQTVTITASAPGWTRSESSIEVLDNDPGELQFSSSKYIEWENNKEITISVIRKNSYNSTITIDYKTTEGTDKNKAVPHEDYVPVSGTLIFESSEIQKSFSIPILQDNIIEGGEIINLILENPSHKVTIGENDTAQLIITDKMIWEKQAGADLSQSPTGNHIKSIWGNSDSDIFAAGWQSTILHFNGKIWEQTELNTGSLVLLEGIWGSSGSDIFAVGNNGIILHFDGSDWKPMVSGTQKNLYCVWGIPESDIYAAGAGVILKYNGNVWQEMSMDTDELPDIRAIWGTSESDVFAAGCDGSILHYNKGLTWNKMETNTDVNIYDIWGSSASDVFAVGAFGAVMHYDGKNWKEMNAGIYDKNILFLEAVWGTSGSDVYAAGSGGTMLHYDGTVWQDMELDSEINLNDLWCPLKTGSGLDLFAVGEAGNIYHYTPETFTE